MKRSLKKLLFQRYQIGSLSHSGREGIPETYWFRKEAVVVTESGLYLYPLQIVLVEYTVFMSIRPSIRDVLVFQFIEKAM